MRRATSPLSDFNKLTLFSKCTVTVVFFAMWCICDQLVFRMIDRTPFANPWYLPSGVEIGFAIFFGWPLLVIAALTRVVNIYVGGSNASALALAVYGVLPAVFSWPLAMPLRRIIQFKGRLDSMALIYSMTPVLVIGTFLKATAMVVLAAATGLSAQADLWPSIVNWWSGDLSAQAILLPLIWAGIGPWSAGYNRVAIRTVPALIFFALAAIATGYLLVSYLPGAHFSKWYVFMPLNVWAVLILPFEGVLLYVSILNIALALLRTQVPSGASSLEEQFFLSILTYMTLFLSVLKTGSERSLRLMETVQVRTDAAIKERAYFLTMLAHELKTPFNLIIGFAEISQTMGGPDSSAAHAVRRSAERLWEIVAKLNFLGSSGLSSKPLEIKDVSVTVLVKKIVGRYLSKARAKNIELQFNLEDCVDCSVQTSAICLEFALSELLDNAIKFSSHGKIVVRVTQAGPRVRFSIEDEGIGIDPASANHLLRTFEQGEKGFGRRFQGLGIGLSFVSLLVEIMHGRLKIENISGQKSGARFSFEIPDLLSGDNRLAVKSLDKQA